MLLCLSRGGQEDCPSVGFSRLGMCKYSFTVGSECSLQMGTVYTGLAVLVIAMLQNHSKQLHVPDAVCMVIAVAVVLYMVVYMVCLLW